MPVQHDMNENISPKVSVIMPAYNSAATIASTIKSVANQTYTNWELLVVDDCSTDTTIDIVNQISTKEPRIKLIKHDRNSGVSVARNTGIDTASGKYVAFLDSDDQWSPDKLRQQVEFHNANPNIPISHTAFIFFNEHGIIRRRFRNLIEPASKKRGLLYPAICYRNTIGILTVIVATDLIRKYRGFDFTLRGTEDHDMWIRIAKDGNRYGYIQNDLALYRVSHGGLSGRLGKYKVALKRLNKKILADRSVDPSKLWSQYYRYVGSLYYHKDQYLLSKCYFAKSLSMAAPGIGSIVTYLYFLKAYLKTITTASR